MQRTGIPPDDEIVDLVIAAESLYLSDLSGDRGEMTYRAGDPCRVVRRRHHRSAEACALVHAKGLQRP